MFDFFVSVSSFLLLRQEKCAQYWPMAEEREMAFRDTRFLVTLLSEDIKSYYTTRVLELQNVNVSLIIIQLQGSYSVKSSNAELNMNSFRLRLEFYLPSHVKFLRSFVAKIQMS